MAKSTVVYNKGFFERTQPASRLSAGVIVPIMMELVRPTCVVDVGCGTGEFLRIFEDKGVQEILGVDGMYVDRSQLAIPQACFRAVDLNRPFTLEKTYDLAVSLEVAEHLEPAAAADFIESLTRLAPVILFSAAIPLQNGYHHVNEQWPDYWAQLFQVRGSGPLTLFVNASGTIAALKIIIVKISSSSVMNRYSRAMKPSRKNFEKRTRICSRLFTRTSSYASAIMGPPGSCSR